MPYPFPLPGPDQNQNDHWCRLDLLPDDTAYRSLCACGWSSTLRPPPPRTPTELATQIGSQLTTIASRIKDRSKLIDRDIEVLIAPALGEAVAAFDDRMVYNRKGSA